MIRIRLHIDGAMLVALDAEGHARSGPKGSDVACASVSTLLRSVCISLETIPGADIQGGAEKEGDLHLRVLSVPGDLRAEVRGITRVLLLGLEEIMKDFPGSLTIDVVSE